MFDLAAAKTRLMIAGTTQDAMVQLCLDAALDLAEQYCDRRFMLASEVATITHSHGDTISLSRYPLVQVISVSDDKGVAVASTAYHVIKGTGQIVFDSRILALHQVLVSYQGGYATLPAGLELALWAVFDAVWNATPGAGKVLGATSQREIKSISSPDIGTITWQPESNNHAASGSFIGSDAMSILLNYRRLDA